MNKLINNVFEKQNISRNTQNQIIGRANRIGRQLPLNVHHLELDI